MRQRNHILIVDDVEVNRTIICNMFENDYDILEAQNGREAWNIISEKKDSLALILLDIIMPLMNGFAVLQKMQELNLLEQIPIILISSDDSSDSRRKGYQFGVSDIITKPFDPYIVKQRVKNILDLYTHKNELEHLVARQTQKLKQVNEYTIDALSTIVEFRNLESGQHINRIKGFTKLLLECLAEKYPEYKLNKQTINLITQASAVHDIGKIAIPDAILLKPGRLTEEEFEVMKTHTTKGCEILNNLTYFKEQDYFKYWYDICRSHHERWDGKGYPDGLMKEDIPLCAQVVSLADVYDALISKRCYKDALQHNKVVEMILNGECGVFPPKIIDCFSTIAEKFRKAALHTN